MSGVLSPFDRIRRTRNEIEYPSSERPEVSASDLRDELVICRAIVELAERVLDEMSPF